MMTAICNGITQTSVINKHREEDEGEYEAWIMVELKSRQLTNEKLGHWTQIKKRKYIR